MKSHNMDEPWKHYAQWKKPDTEGQILYEPTYTRDLEVNPQRGEESLGARGGDPGGYCLMSRERLFGRMKQFWKWTAVMNIQHYECISCQRTVPLKMLKRISLAAYNVTMRRCHCYGSGSISGPGTSTCCRCGFPQKAVVYFIYPSIF